MNSPLWQLSPLKPSTQAHEYTPSGKTLQVPPFWQVPGPQTEGGLESFDKSFQFEILPEDQQPETDPSHVGP